MNADGSIKHLIPEGGYIDETRSDKNSYTLRAQINFNRTFDEKHEVSAIAGGERRAVHSTSTYVEKYGYDKLHFELGDINGYTPDGPVDMVITLHACDTATDYALFNAISWNVKLILSVPCCQHEVNAQMHAEHLSLFTRYGLIQERMAALITDSIRANLLTYMGYSTQVVEFIDMAHTPKNILLRARKAKLPESTKRQALEEVRTALEEFHIQPTLYTLLVK